MVGDSKTDLEHGMPEKMVGAESLDMCRDKDTGLLQESYTASGDRPSHSLAYTALHSPDRSPPERDKSFEAMFHFLILYSQSIG